jgi:DNA-binding response OmpR family regulator
MPRVLIVDDELPQRVLVRETLASDPRFTFDEAADGMQALRQARGTRPDLIILDVMMPQMDGFQVCRILKSDPTLRDVPVILLTALGHVEDRATARDLGVYAFINKPFDETELHSKVRSALRQDQA